MSIHKLTAGSGYDYLTRQVAAMDATDKGHTGLASYYTERGESPGVWIGSGMAGIEGLDPGDAVTADQMRALFGSGQHPLSAQRLEATIAALDAPATATHSGRERADSADAEGADQQPGLGQRGGPTRHGQSHSSSETQAPSRRPIHPLTRAQVGAATRLGTPFKVYDATDISPFRIAVARRVAECNTQAGLPTRHPVAASQRARIRTTVGTEMFAAEHGRVPADARELAGFIAKNSRTGPVTVAGYDLTFSPVKSVSTLWAVADGATAATIERAHQAAVADAISFIEDHALYTRLGTNGIRQVPARGVVATAFTHRDSRAGDPDLHTHLAIANKVQEPDGRWLAIDGRVLFKATVSASETYNTALEHHLSRALGVRFAERPARPASPSTSPAAPAPGAAGAGELAGPGSVSGRDKRPVREIIGVETALNQRWSSRRASIEQRRDELVKVFHGEHGRPPTPVETLHLAQQATLETRDAKHEPRTLAEQREQWHRQAVAALGSESALEAMIGTALSPPPTTPTATATGLTAAGREAVDQRFVATAAREVVRAVEGHRATWQVWHIHAESLRSVRSAAVVPAERVQQVAIAVTTRALQTYSTQLTGPAQPAGTAADQIREPALLRRPDGTSMYEVAGAAWFTSSRILEAEQRVVAAAGLTDGRQVEEQVVSIALLESTANQMQLNPGQADLVRHMATSGHRVQLAIAPAGSGKTTAMRVLASAWHESGGHVVGLAPSAVAAASLGEQIDGPVDTLAKLTWSLKHGQLPAWAARIGPDTLVVIDEAGMADTLSLDVTVQFVMARGGSVRLVGDDQQLSAIGVGGALRDIATHHGALRLNALIRFTDPAEGAATLALREGRAEALGFYLDHHRFHIGDLATMTDDVFSGWVADDANGLDAVMLAPTRELVAELNRRARAHRLNTPAAETGQDHVDPLHASRSDAPDAATTIPGTFPDRPESTLSDDNRASAGDVVITRRNDRRLAVSATDWVHNGDRWTVRKVHPDGSLDVAHNGQGCHVRLPASYVAQNVELGYASTVHTAQGISADSMHGLVAGSESRQLFYTMMTRGRHANHAYLSTVGDGDPHSAIEPEMTRPSTGVEFLERILARDASPVSATSYQRQLAEPERQLGNATSRYLDSLYLAAETLVGPETRDRLLDIAEHIQTGMTEQPAWPALRAQLHLIAAHGVDPVLTLLDAANQRPIDTATDAAAVLDWRLDDTGDRSTSRGPLPWTPGIPEGLRESIWGRYLQARHDLVGHLAEQVRRRATRSDLDGSDIHGPDLRDADGRDHTGATIGHRTRPNVDAEAGDPGQQAAGHARPVSLYGPELPAYVASLDPQLAGDIAVWRAAMEVDPEDRRPTGRPQPQKAAVTWQRRLNRRVRHHHQAALAEWATSLETIQAGLSRDDYAPTLANRLAAIARAGLDAPAMLRGAANRPLPDEYPCAALWWRLSRQLSPAVAAQVDTDEPMTTSWLPQLREHLGDRAADQLQRSPWWPALLTNIDESLQRGWTLSALTDQLLIPRPQPAATPGGAPSNGTLESPTSGDDAARAATWRISLMLDVDNAHGAHEPPPDPAEAQGHAPSFEDVTAAHQLFAVPTEPHWSEALDGPPPIDHHLGARYLDAQDIEGPKAGADAGGTGREHLAPEIVDADLTRASLLRETAPPQEPDERQIEEAIRRARAWDQSPVSRERMLEVNQMAMDYFETHLPGSWAHHHLLSLFALDIAGHPLFRPGHAPDGWTNLVTDLRSRGVTNTELLETGLASRASTGHLIDRFRDRLVLPVIHHGEVLGFVARRQPDLNDNETLKTEQHRHGPKYLNTPSTLLFTKGAQLYGADDKALADGATPVLVEGPMDAIAVTLATGGGHVGLAPLGTALTVDQAHQLASYGRAPIVATDGDLAGQKAAERDFWLLTPHTLDPLYAHMPAGTDPADLLADQGPAALAATLTTAKPLAHAMLNQRLAALDPAEARAAALQILAACTQATWEPGLDHLAAALCQRADAHRADGPIKRSVETRTLRRDLRDAVQAWDRNPHEAAALAAASADPGHTSEAPDRVGFEQPREEPLQANSIPDWAALADEADPRLRSEPTWGALRDTLNQAHHEGHNVPATVAALIRHRPLGQQPAVDLRYRLTAALDLAVSVTDPSPTPDSRLDAAVPKHSPSPRRQHAERRPAPGQPPASPRR